MSSKLRVEHRPQFESFEESLERQIACRNEVIESRGAHLSLADGGEEISSADSGGAAASNLLILAEHSHTYTSGRGVKFSSPSAKPFSDVDHIELGRGGETTYHGPGQLVAYPIFSLDIVGRDVHVFLRKLEGAILLCLKRFGISAVRREGLTGVWVERQDGSFGKIASIGIGVKKWVSFHGLAINLDADLNYFKAISPCGLDGSLVTNLNDELALLEKTEFPSRQEVEQALVTALSKVFKLELEEGTETDKFFRPPWLKASPHRAKDFQSTKEVIEDLRLVTVCEEAHCPNIGECWSHNTATFMVMGENCTRRCGFCSVKDGTKGNNLEPLDIFEPHKVAVAVQKLGLKHVVITSVNRDDLPDMGAEHFNQVVKQTLKLNPDCEIELLIPDMRGDKELLRTILSNGQVKVLNHNVETVPRLYRQVRPGSKFERSLSILRGAHQISDTVKTKSGFMLGLGETEEEVVELLQELKTAGVNIVTIGQYLRPTEKQLPIKEYVRPEKFEMFKHIGLEMGFDYVESGPLVRSSYHAWKHSSSPEPISPEPLASNLNSSDKGSRQYA